jgi:hypothetical protein
MRDDIARRSRSGLPFILASVVLWSAIALVWLLPLPGIAARNLLTFCCAVPHIPLAYAISRAIRAEFSPKDNPLHTLGM